jgi:hypothetical protein
MRADGAAALARRAEAVQVGTQYLGNSALQRIQFEFEGLTPGEQIALAKGSRSEIDRLLGVKGQ